MYDRIIITLRSKDWYRRIFDFLLSKFLIILPVSFRRKLFSGDQYHCPICDSDLRAFLILHRPYHRWCPVCLSLQRHRLIWIFLQRHTSLLDNKHKKILHIAPEPSLASQLRVLEKAHYISGDLEAHKAMIRIDITNINMPDGSQDVIVCNHVLEHVRDDSKAMSELARILNEDGFALITVPITAEDTIEDPLVTNAADRERLFGQRDHVRRYGKDVVSRLEQNGFEVSTYDTEDIASDEEVCIFGLKKQAPIFYCRKSA